MINVIDTIAYLVARLRWKLYRVFLRLTLGPVGGYGPHRNMVYSISSSIDDDVRAHVLEDVELEPAHIESFDLGGGGSPSPIPLSSSFQRAISIA